MPLSRPSRVTSKENFSVGGWKTGDLIQQEANVIVTRHRLKRRVSHNILLNYVYSGATIRRKRYDCFNDSSAFRHVDVGTYKQPTFYWCARLLTSNLYLPNWRSPYHDLKRANLLQLHIKHLTVSFSTGWNAATDCCVSHTSSSVSDPSGSMFIQTLWN